MSMYSHRHYAHIAKLISEIGGNTDYLSPDSLRRAFASAFEADNPDFDRDKFLKAAEGRPSGSDKRPSVIRRRTDKIMAGRGAFGEGGGK